MDLVAVRVTDVGAVIVWRVVRARARLAFIRRAGLDCRRIGSVYRGACRRGKSGHATVARYRRLAVVGLADPELCRRFPRTVPRGPVLVLALDALDPERREHGVVERGCAVKVAGSDHHMAEHSQS